jgi:hypothetical protein
MPYRWRAWIVLSGASVVLFAVLPSNAQTPARTASQTPRMPDGKPNFTGLWEALGPLGGQHACG